MSAMWEEVALQLIICAGNARAYAYQALQHAENRKFTAASSDLAAAQEELAQAHRRQSALLQQDAASPGPAPSLLLVHAQDHLMNAMSECRLIEAMLGLHQRLAVLEDVELRRE